MKILIIGSGGREHALAWKIKQSPRVQKIFCVPGNGGIAELAECVNIPIDGKDGFLALLDFAGKEQIDLTVVGPEAALVAGIVDVFEKAGLKIFGPSQAAARLEGSKVFAKDFMHRFSIPTAFYRTFYSLEEAKHFLAHTHFPLVVKADGLAAGKGVVICQTQKQAEEALKQLIVEKLFKEAGQTVVIEEYLEGEEVSILAICDGENYLLLPSSQDHKRIFDDDLGPNTGGMGAYSPVPFVNDSLLKQIEARVIEPTVRGMRKEGSPFKGVLYAGLMLTMDGPKVLEFNARFGDPETQVLLPRLKSDLVEIMLASCEERLKTIRLEWDRRSCVCVVMSSGGYPGNFEVGKEILGLDPAGQIADVMVFHASTKRDGLTVMTGGGRVLGVTALGDGIEAAIKKVYSAVETISFDRCFFRRDIGAKALKNAKQRESQRENTLNH